MDDFLGLLGQAVRQRGGLLGGLLPLSAEEKRAREMEELRMQFLRQQMEQQQAAREAEQQKALQAQEAARQAAEEQQRITQAGQDPFAMFRASGPAPKWGPQEALTAQMSAAQSPGTKKILGELADKFQPEFGLDLKPVQRPDGSLGYVQANKRGGVRSVENVTLPPENVVIDRGGSLEVMDKLRTKPGTSLPRTLTPDQIQDNAVARANLGLRAQEIAAAREANQVAREVGGGQANRELGKLVQDMRKEYNGLEPVKNYKAAAPIAAAAASAPDTPAGDLDLIYAVGKVLDPGSVVREGELNLVIKSGTPLQQFQGYVRMIAQGKGRLPPAQRAQLVQMLNGRMTELKRSHDMAAAPFVQQAQRMQLPAQEVFGDEPAGNLTPAEQRELDELRARFGRK